MVFPILNKRPKENDNRGTRINFKTLLIKERVEWGKIEAEKQSHIKRAALLRNNKYN